MSMVTPEHLASIDAELWPTIAYVTAPGRVINARARKAEADFAKACQKAEIELGGASPDVVVSHDELFVRIAERGWTGLAEGYMAGEWDAPDLPAALAKLIGSGYRPIRVRKPFRATGGPNGELPAELIALYTGDGVSDAGGLFSSGVRTTERTAVKSYVRGAGWGREPKLHYVNITDVADPAGVDKPDLADASRRSFDSLLDIACVGQGTDLLELPSGGGALALIATHRGAHVDFLSHDYDHLQAAIEYLTLNGASALTHPKLIDAPVPGRGEVRGEYDAIVSVERMETLSESERVRFARALDRMLALEGFVALQAVVATESFGAVARDALEVLRGYIWPRLSFFSVTDMHRLFDRETNIRITSQIHFGSHYLRALELQRQLFEGNERQAAAAGFDAVFRRLWAYRFALLEALFHLGALDAAQFGGTRRNRGGRR